MKKIFLLIILFVLCLSGYSQLLQKTYRWNETVTLDNSSNDTIYLWGELDKDFTIGVEFFINIKYSNVTTSTVKFGFLVGNLDGGETAVSLDGLNAFYTLDNVAGFDYRGRTVRSDGFHSIGKLLSDRAAFCIITSESVSGTIEIEFVQRIYYNKL